MKKSVPISHFRHEDLISPSVRKAMMKSSNFQRVVLGHVPMSHMYGNCTVQLYTLMQGGRIICLPKYTPKAFLSGIEKYKVTVTLLSDIFR